MHSTKPEPQMNQVPNLITSSYEMHILAANPEGKRPLGRPRCRWKIILEGILGNWV
jgi:hypothetical protein